MKIHELGHVVLFVTNLEKSVHFYHDILGFKMVAEQPGMAVFSTGRTHHEMLLIEIGGHAKPAHAPEPGLYHIGFKIGDTDQELKSAITELNKNNVEIVGLSDHTVTHSLYILDPDGNELELYVDINDEWKANPQAILASVKPLNLD